MVVEWIRVRVAPEARDDFVAADREVWTPGLARQAGFLDKEVWLGDDDTDLVLVIRWRRKEEWEEIPRDRLAELERRFGEAFGEPYQVVEVRSYRAVDEVTAGVAGRSGPRA